MSTHEFDQEPNEMAKYMDPEIYRAAKSGDLRKFKRLTGDIEGPPNFEQVSPQEDTVLHIAASSGHNLLAELILSHHPGLFSTKNAANSLPIHAAAYSGSLATVETLVSSDNVSADAVESALTGVNKDNETPLHVALRNRHEDVATFLFRRWPGVLSFQNKEGKSPLYMAAEAGYFRLVKLMMEQRAEEAVTDSSKSLVHAAIKGRNKGVLDAILSKQPDLVHVKDEDGTTALSFAISVGYREGVHYVLDKFPVALYQRDRSGNFPIHKASGEDRVDVIRKIVQRRPDAAELLDQQGQNILHVAAKYGKIDVVNYILETRELGKLLNEADEKGNTPLHLAATDGQSRTTHALTWDKRVRFDLTNNEGKTALDIAEDYTGHQFSKRVTLFILQSAVTSKAMRPMSRASKLLHTKEYAGDHMVNTLLLVSILVVTVTFAAGFTVPGGFNIFSPHEGMATLVRKLSFQLFVITNTVALYCSIIAAVNLIWAQYGDANLVNGAINMSGPLLGVALIMMSVAFTTGVHVVVSDLHWLATVVLVMGSVSLFILTSRSLPLFPGYIQLLLCQPPRLMQLITKLYIGRKKSF